jgi:NAD(P)-dependent dehydrogenase (short-subunit alcohol dehydrogenase family)
VIDERTLGFADFGGNQQYVTLGNLLENPKAFIFLMDYANSQRVKLWGTARVIDDDPDLLDKLRDPDYPGKVERAIVFAVEAWDINGPQHIHQRFLPLGQITEEHFDKTFDVNVKGLLFTVQKALPLLRDGGSIILNASITATKGLAAFSVYSASKAAVRSFARTWTTDLKARKIRVNVVSPGVIITPAYKTALGMTKEQIKVYAASTAITTPLGRPGTTDEIAKAVVFLASDDSSYVTGIELFVDGGMTQI